MNLDRLKELHAPDGWTGRWCDTCLESGSMDSERQDWPCDTAQELYTDAEIRAVRERQREEYEAWVEQQRATVDSIRAADPEAYHQLVEATAEQVRQQQAIRSIWSKEIAFQAMPILRYSRIVARDGSVDDHLQTGQFARDAARDSS